MEFKHGLMSRLPSVNQLRLELEDVLERVDEAADPDWKEQALDAVERTCRARHEFISDDVWEVGGLESTREDRALGPIMIRAQRAGWCVKTDRMRPSKRSHLSGKPVWRSLIYEGVNPCVAQ